MAKEAGKSPDLGIEVVGYLDDDVAKAGMKIHGAPVLGTLDVLEAQVEKTNAQRVIITTNRIPASTILKIVDRCRDMGVEVRIVPGLYEMLGSDISMQKLREVRIEDLLSRNPVAPSLSLEDLTRLYQGKSVLVTGAGGSIGAELCRQVLLFNPRALLMLERDENNLFEIDRELARTDTQDLRQPVLADITDQRALERIFKKHKPDVVLHAAAYKHVPMMERFPAAAAANNILGTKLLIEQSDLAQVERFIMISTDKAVNPTSVMGATKRFAELLIQHAANRSPTLFSCVRFGNVLGSRGSVVGIFTEQIKRGGPVTVTNKDATRYFMTIQESVNLVLQASTLERDGAVFLLDMGKPVRILDLAKQMIRLSGFDEDEIPVDIVGFRPGEKLFEELRVDTDGVEPTALRKIYRVTPEMGSESLLRELTERMTFLVKNRDHKGVRRALADLGIGYNVVALGNHAKGS
jgi:FlaA1/EpsC-like NDP-sugar epimerase